MLWPWPNTQASEESLSACKTAFQRTSQLLGFLDKLMKAMLIILPEVSNKPQTEKQVYFTKKVIRNTALDFQPPLQKLQNKKPNNISHKASRISGTKKSSKISWKSKDGKMPKPSISRDTAESGASLQLHQSKTKSVTIIKSMMAQLLLSCLHQSSPNQRAIPGQWRIHGEVLALGTMISKMKTWPKTKMLQIKKHGTAAVVQSSKQPLWTLSLSLSSLPRLVQQLKPLQQPLKPNSHVIAFQAIPQKLCRKSGSKKILKVMEIACTELWQALVLGSRMEEP